MRYYFLTTLIIAFSFSQANAGLFCSELKCDLSINKFSKREIKTEKVVKRFEEKTYAQSSVSANVNVIEHLTKSPSYMFGDGSGTALSNCKIEGVYTILLQYRVYATTDDEYVTVGTLTCDKVYFDDKNKEEKAIALCSKAMDCASSIKDTGTLRDYIELKNKLCDKIDSRSITKEDAIFDSKIDKKVTPYGDIQSSESSKGVSK